MKDDYSKKEILASDIIAALIWLFVFACFVWLIDAVTVSMLNSVFSFMQYS